MATQKPQFDMDAALKALREGKDLTGKDGVLTPLIKQLTEAALQAERDGHLAQDDTPNRKNGSTSKTVKSPLGSFELQTPRDRAGTFGGATVDAKAAEDAAAVLGENTDKSAATELSDLFKGGRTPKASELEKFSERQGWTRSQTENGPIKFADKNGINR